MEPRRSVVVGSRLGTARPSPAAWKDSSSMSDYEPSLGPDLLDLEHDILLVAGSRAEVARLAPVATAFAAAGRIRALTVATGPDPMAVHEAFEALGVPVDVTLLLRELPNPHPAAVASIVM